MKLNEFLATISRTCGVSIRMLKGGCTAVTIDGVAYEIIAYGYLPNVTVSEICTDRDGIIIYCNIEDIQGGMA